MILALLGKAYTGKTTIADALEDLDGARGIYEVYSFTDHLKELAVNAVNHVAAHRQFSVWEIKQDKAKFRRFIQEFGSVLDFEHDPRYIEGYLYDILRRYPNSYQGAGLHLVVDCLRSIEQVRGAQRMGAKVIGVDVGLVDRFRFAAKTVGSSDLKVGQRLVTQADEHPIDGSLDLSAMPIDLRVINAHRSPVTAVADEIAAWVEQVTNYREEVISG